MRRTPEAVPDGDDLRRRLGELDGRGYKAYKDLRGRWDFPDFTLWIDHVQGDPFAAPSKMRLRVAAERAGFPAELYANTVRRVALEDFVARAAAAAIPDPRRRGGVHVDAGGQDVLERSAAVVCEDFVEARAEVGLPAAGRRIRGREAARLLCERLPEIVRTSLLFENLDADAARRFVEGVENQDALRNALAARGLVAFVADGSLLPRESGVSDRPLAGAEAVPFIAPESLRVELELPHAVDGQRRVTGLGIPAGVTLIVGGGYHGKSTLLRALVRGVHPKIPGDGRETVVTRADAVAVRAEDGRRVEAVDLRPFIGRLPGGRPTDVFRSEDASGSTSQAANILEAVESGAHLLLLDEDTSATNFMLRDARMQALVQAEDEPITPFVDRVRELHDRWGVSTVLVMGGCGDYFDVADTVIAMREFVPSDVTQEARRVAQAHPTGRRREAPASLETPAGRVPRAESFDPSKGRREISIQVRDRNELRFGTETLDLRALEQIVDPSQTRALGGALALTGRHFADGRRTLREIVDALDARVDEAGIDVLDPYWREEEHPGNLARPRRHEIAAAINRLRSLRVER